MNMKHKLKWALAAILILSPLVPVGAAVFPSIRGTAIELTEKATATLAGCRTGKPCLFWNGSADGPTWKKADGTSFTISGDGSLPDQTGNSGEYLTTNGTTASWAAVSGGSHGIVDWDEALTLGNANNAASSTFAYIGDAASTGFATWTSDSVAAGDYTLYWFINGYKVDGTDMTTFRVMVDTVAVTQPTANSLSGTSEYESVSRFVPLTLTAGTHTFRMQWKTISATASVNTQSTLYFALMGPL
jgi:hypothetical protein